MRYILLTIFFITAIQSFGQFAKNDKALGATFTFKMHHSPKSSALASKAYAYSASPSFGFLVSKNLEIGGQLGYSSTYIENNSADDVAEFRINRVTAGAYARRYFVLSKRFLFSLTGNIYYGRGKIAEKTTDAVTFESSTTNSNVNELGTMIRPNFTFLPTTNLGIQASIGYVTYQFAKNETTGRQTNHFDMDLGMLNVGVFYYFRKARE